MDGPLWHYWHPVATCDDVTADRPFGTMLLGEPLVLFRTDAGVSLFRDRCAHRGARLSLGRIAAGCLVCPYHAWHYAADGRVVKIPSLPADAQNIPSAAQVTRYAVEERYGLVWAALEEPVLPIPEFPEWDDRTYHTFLSLKMDMAASAGRFTDNGLDISHFPFVHPGALGDPEQPLTPECAIDLTDYGFSYSYSRDEAGAGHFSETAEVLESRIMQHIPYTRHRVLTSSKGHSVQYVSAQPLDATHCRIFLFESRDHSLDVSDATFATFTTSLLKQDRAIVESQIPPTMPTALADELHMAGPDSVGLAYRRVLREAGIEAA